MAERPACTINAPHRRYRPLNDIRLGWRAGSVAAGSPAGTPAGIPSKHIHFIAKVRARGGVKKINKAHSSLNNVFHGSVVLSGFPPARP